MPQEVVTRPQFRSPEPLLKPRSVAIVGASERAKWPGQIFRHLGAFGYPGKVFPVNPRLERIWDTTCYPDLASLPEPPDHAVVIVPAPAVLDVLTKGVAAGLRSATVYSAQIGEGKDPEIIARGKALRALIDRSGLLLCGPNCMGVSSLHQRYFGYPSQDLCELQPGSVSLVSQSGGTVVYLARTAAARGVNFNHLVSSGNEMGLDLADYVNYFVDDPGTSAIALFIEGIHRPEAFMMAAARALAARKPIVAIKTGRSLRSREAAQSHTGAISGDYDVFSAMCQRFGIILCPSLDDMVETLLVVQNGRLPKGPRVGWVTTSGGTVDLLHDYIDLDGRLETPEYAATTKQALRKFVSAELEIKNPLDAGDPPNDAGSATMCALAAADPNVDMVAWAATNHRGAAARDPAPFQDLMAGTDKPVFGFIRMIAPTDPKAVEFQQAIGFPLLQGLPATVRAMSSLAIYANRVRKGVPRLPPAEEGAEAPDQQGVAADLAAAGIPGPASRFAASPEEAARAAADIGFPVALKIVSSQIVHKTEVGGVRLHLKSSKEVETEARSLAAAIRATQPDADIEGFLVQEMVSGTEAILGARTDPLYGPMIVLGSGGILVELLKDLSFRLLPVDADDASEMLSELKLSKILSGFRGQPPGDIAALVRAVVAMSDYYTRHRSVLSDVEINPLIIREDGRGVCAIDVRFTRS